MNHYMQGGVSDGDGGEDSEEGSKERRAAAVRGAPSPPPLSPLLHGLLRALSYGDGIHGGGKNVALEAGNSWVEAAPHELGFPSLYRLPDFHQPPLGLQ